MAKIEIDKTELNIRHAFDDCTGIHYYKQGKEYIVDLHHRENPKQEYSEETKDQTFIYNDRSQWLKGISNLCDLWEVVERDHTDSIYIDLNSNVRVVVCPEYKDVGEKYYIGMIYQRENETDEYTEAHNTASFSSENKSIVKNAIIKYLKELHIDTMLLSCM